MVGLGLSGSSSAPVVATAAASRAATFSVDGGADAQQTKSSSAEEYVEDAFETESLSEEICADGSASLDLQASGQQLDRCVIGGNATTSGSMESDVADKDESAPPGGRAASTDSAAALSSAALAEDVPKKQGTGGQDVVELEEASVEEDFNFSDEGSFEGYEGSKSDSNADF